MAKRNCPTLQKSLDWCEGMPSHPGIRRRVYFCNKNLIVAYPTLPRDELGRPTTAVLEGNFELMDGAYWQFLDINIDKSTVTSDPQGEAPSQTQLNKATLVHNGIDEEATAAAGWLNNSDCVFIVEDMPGKFRVLGNNKWRTKTTTKQDLGQGTNPASTTIEVEVTDEVAPPFYFGTLETEDGPIGPDAAVEPTVSTKSINIGMGDFVKIDFYPKDGNWDFNSNNDRVATVDQYGVVTGVTRGTCLINCLYNGENIKAINCEVHISQIDPSGGEEPETPPADEPLLSPTATTLKIGDNCPLILLRLNDDVENWTFTSDEERIAEVSIYDGKNEPAHAEIIANSIGETLITATQESFNGQSLDEPVNVEINVSVITDQEVTVGPGGTSVLNLAPQSGWSGVIDDPDVATVAISDGQVTITGGDGSGETDLLLTNIDGQELEIHVIVDGNLAG